MNGRRFHLREFDCFAFQRVPFVNFYGKDFRPTDLQIFLKVPLALCHDILRGIERQTHAGSADKNDNLGQKDILEILKNSIWSTNQNIIIFAVLFVKIRPQPSRKF